ncbi:hypothetical protein PInf_006818 [Phytophthora infestans]|nr:hypothetical protein PInf_006818 [Phytophthora infestans]
MALPPRGLWDVTYLGAKYPWLRVDQQALEEFRSPFQWVSDDPPHSPTRSNDDGSDDKVRSQATDTQGTNNAASIEDFVIPPLEFSIDSSPFIPLYSAPTPLILPDEDRQQSIESVLESLQQDHESLKQQRRKKWKKRKKPTNLLSLRFPAITPKSLSSVSTVTSMKRNPTQRLLEKYSQQIKNLTAEEHRLEENVMSRISEEKARLPLTFLFERNLMRRSDAQQDGLRIVTAIFAKLQHRILYNSFIRWKDFLECIQHEERKREALCEAQQRAVALFKRVSSDAHIGTLATGFAHWKMATHNMIEQERNLAASVIQNAERARRSRQHLESLRLAAQAQDYRRNQSIQALLRFERYGTMMKWSTLRIGGDFAKQTRAAQTLQLFLRRLAVRRRIARRVMRRQGAVRIQTQWRAHLARVEAERRRVERAIRVAIECKAAMHIQRVARGFLGRNRAFRRKLWLQKAKVAVLRLEIWWRKQWFLALLSVKFRQRKRKIDDDRARAAAEEVARRHWRSVIAVQCVVRSLFARKVYARRLKARQKQQAAVFLQRFWRRRRGLYALGLRFVERRERIAQSRLQSAIVIQCAFRCYWARHKRVLLAEEKQKRRRASTVIQRHVRGRRARNDYRQARNAALVIQCSTRCALARRRRSRRQTAVHKLQSWITGVYSCRAARQVLNGLRVEAQRREASIIFIQKLVRQREAQQTARLFREALSIVKIEQQRYFGSDSDAGIGWTTHQASSVLLTYVTQRFLEDDSCFTTKELRWLRAQVQAGYERLAREDRAAVYLQRRYRGYVARMGYWVYRLQMEELRRLKEKKAVVIQSAAKRWLAKRYVRRLREQRRLAELKEEYIRERRRKEEERLWKERYDREQMELCVQRAQEAANQVREARREADLARVKAEAAEYRAKELAAEREIEALLKTPVKQENDDKKYESHDKEEEKDPWISLTDDYGNVYYYNERTEESSWDPPPPRIKRPNTSPEEEEKKDTSVEDHESSKVEEVDPLEEVLREGKCVKCQQVQSTKRCLDCKDTNRAFYCTACFKQHTASGSSEENSALNEVKYDFEVVSMAAIRPARCESGVDCTLDEDNPPTTSNNQEGEKNLAAYYCYECPTTTTSGCFYCEACFARDHATAMKLRHVDNALRFRRGALLCCDCGHSLAIRQCESCGGEKFCEACFTSSHTGSQRRIMTHTWTALDVLRDLLEKETDTYCVECDVRASCRLCNLCGDGFCDGCFNKTHAKGAKRRHTWLPWSVAAQHGDWIEIKDEKTTVFYNVETKLSTTEKPKVLLSGEERHRLALAEREQLQRRRQVELESEVVKLQEQVRELQAQNRPESRARTPERGVDPSQNTTNPPKRGALSRMFNRKPTPETRQGAAEDRVEANNQPVSSPAFQQAMVQEIAAHSAALNKPK